MSEKRYVRVWQTWTTEPRRSSEPAMEEGVPVANISTVRQQMQMCRVQKRLSVSRLADMLGCDASLLAAFERGEDTVDESTLRALRRTLDL